MLNLTHWQTWRLKTVECWFNHHKPTSGVANHSSIDCKWLPLQESHHRPILIASHRFNFCNTNNSPLLESFFFFFLIPAQVITDFLPRHNGPSSAPLPFLVTSWKLKGAATLKSLPVFPPWCTFISAPICVSVSSGSAKGFENFSVHQSSTSERLETGGNSQVEKLFKCCRTLQSN